MSLQVAILKVLVSHPEGRATVAALNSDLCILASQDGVLPEAVVETPVSKTARGF